jgi:hypothetical protein
MPGPFNTSKPHSGDNWRMPAELAGAIIEVAREHRTGALQPDLQERSAYSDLAVVSVKNMTGGSLPRFSVVGLDAPIFDPTLGDDALAAFQSFVGFHAVVPTLAGYEGYYGILLEPLGDGAIGTAAVSGVVPVRLNVISPGDEWAEVSDGLTSCLQTGPTGSAQILWRQAGAGPMWGVVRLTTTRLRTFVAMIHATGPNGEADTTDQRYWVRAQTIGDTTIPLHEYQFYENTADYYWGLATNLAELPTGTHHLKPGTFVLVTEMALREGAPTIHGWSAGTAYVFSDRGPAQPNPLLDGTVHSDTAAVAPVAGDLVYGNGTPQWDRKPRGNDKDLLQTSGTSLVWNSLAAILAGAGGVSGTFYPVVGLRVNGTDIQAQNQEITVVNGLITSIGDVSAWFSWTTGTICGSGGS